MELNDLYCAQNIIRVIKSGRIKWAGHVECMGGDGKCVQGFGGEN